VARTGCYRPRLLARARRHRPATALNLRRGPDLAIRDRTSTRGGPYSAPSAVLRVREETGCLGRSETWPSADAGLDYRFVQQTAGDSHDRSGDTSLVWIVSVGRLLRDESDRPQASQITLGYCDAGMAGSGGRDRTSSACAEPSPFATRPASVQGMHSVAVWEVR
jgi:hypothetical protein